MWCSMANGLKKLVESMTCINAFERKFWKINLNVVTDEKINHNIVTGEKINQNVGTDEQINQNMVTDEKTWKIWRSKQKIADAKRMEISVMDAKIDLKVVMDQSIFKIGGWNESQPRSQKSFENVIDENLPWLLLGIPRRDPFFVTHYSERRSESSDQHMKTLVSLREGLRVVMQCYKRQHSAHFYWLHEHPGGPASRREPMMRTFAKESTAY